jgi:hypothetical protein
MPFPGLALGWPPRRYPEWHLQWTHSGWHSEVRDIGESRPRLFQPTGSRSEIDQINDWKHQVRRRAAVSGQVDATEANV